MKYWLLPVDTTSPARLDDWNFTFKPRPEWRDGPVEHHFLVMVSASAARGDGIVLWRHQYGGGVVALGKITETVQAGADANGELGQIIGKYARVSGYDYQYARIEYQALMMSAPLTADHLRSNGFEAIEAQASLAIAKEEHDVPEPVKLSLSRREWINLVKLSESSPLPADWPTAWHINPGEIVRRRSQVHEVYGGNTRARIAPSASTPNIMVFANAESSPGMELPEWKDGALQILANTDYGKRLSGDNLVVIRHIRRGLALRVFHVVRDGCLYLGEFTIAQNNPVDRHESIIRKSVFARDGFETKDIPVLRLEPRDGGRALTSFREGRDATPIALTVRRSTTVTKISWHRETGEPLGPSSDETSTIHKLRTVLERDPEATSAISMLDDANSVAMLIQYARHRAGLAELRAIVEAPGSTEHALQKQLHRMPWVFGGEFLSETARRNLTAQDQLDMSLIRADGSLHGVELKNANIEKLVRRHRGHLVVGAQVNEAVGQAMNYLRSLDEQRPQILADLKIDCRRASITVVIGHTAFVSADCDRHEILEAIRTYNSHLSRVTVMTYDTLIDTAERALALAEENA